MENVILTVLNYAQNMREQYLLVKLFETALVEEIQYGRRPHVLTHSLSISSIGPRCLKSAILSLAILQSSRWLSTTLGTIVVYRVTCM